MTLMKIQGLLRSFNQSKEILNGLQLLSPAACLTGQHTCRTASLPPTSRLHVRNLHSKCTALTKSHSCLIQPKCHIRKLYPDPFELDPEYFLPPEEDANLDLDHVPVLGNKGPGIVANVQEAAKGNNLGRLFAVIHIDGQQRKVTTEDLVIINGFFPPQIGDKIRLEKVMLVGGKDFTLYGRPLLSRDMVQVNATVVEKTLSHVRIHFTKMKRYRRLKLLQHPQSVIVINSIDIDPSAL